jgi:hypothetical protein
MKRAFDLMMCGALLMSPVFFRRSQRRFAAIPVALGAVGVVRCFMARQAESRAFNPSRELAEAVADPDIARAPHLRTHLE